MEHFGVSLIIDGTYAISPNTHFITVRTEDTNGDGKLGAGDRVTVSKENLDDGESWSEGFILNPNKSFSENRLVHGVNKILRRNDVGKLAYVDANRGELVFADQYYGVQAAVNLTDGAVNYAGR